jgi:2OG-Fe(II) oxygenase superfamily
VIKFTRAGAALASIDLVLGSDLSLEAARHAFFDHHCVKIRGFLADDLFSQVLADIRPDDFYERMHGGFGSEACLKNDSPAVTLLWLLVNDERLFRAVEAVTGCPAIGSFEGRIYRFTDSPSHHDDWHDDLADNRLVAMSVNLSGHAYDGGILRIRDSTSGEILHEESNTGPGDALVFRLAPELQHCVTKVTGSRPKTAFAGWFKSAPDYRTLLGLHRAP